MSRSNPLTLLIDLSSIDPVRPDAAGEYALQLTGALVRLAAHADVVVLEPGYRGRHPAAEVLLLPAGGRPRPGYRCFTAIHDLPHLAGGFAGFAHRFRAAFATSRSEKVIAPSEFAAAAIETRLRVPRRDIAVILPGLEPDFGRSSRDEAAAVRAEFGLPERYLLSFGDEASAEAAWAGASRPAEGAGLVHHGQLGAEGNRLPALLSGAVGVILRGASGNPIRALQAMACGSPPIVGGDGSFPEVVRDAGLTVSPDRPGDWSEAISALYRSRPLRAQLSSRARELAGSFSSERAARSVLGLI